MSNAIDIGLSASVTAKNLIAIAPADSAPIRRRIKQAEEVNKLIDVTQGRRTRSALFMSDGSVVLSSVEPKTLAGRMD